MMRFVEDQSVCMFRRGCANDRGMSNLDDLSSEDLASESTIGKNTTTTGVLFTNAESTAPTCDCYQRSELSMTGQFLKSRS